VFLIKRTAGLPGLSHSTPQARNFSWLYRQLSEPELPEVEGKRVGDTPFAYVADLDGDEIEIWFE
jgi:hypothetical protein